MRLILCNCPPDQATTLAHALVERKLAACVNILPSVQSIYMWEGKLCNETEATLLIKTSQDRVQDTIQELAKLHPYDVPEIIALPIQEGHEPYIQWVRDETKPL